ncbi:hypothetical protein ACE6H2_011519 [Prunus campanulata]
MICWNWIFCCLCLLLSLPSLPYFLINPTSLHTSIAVKQASNCRETERDQNYHGFVSFRFITLDSNCWPIYEG